MSCDNYKRLPEIKAPTLIMAGSAACVAILVLTFSPTIRNYRLSQGIVAGTMCNFLLSRYWVFQKGVSVREAP